MKRIKRRKGSVIVVGTALEHIAIELEKQNAFRLYEIESKTNEEKALKKLKDKLNKIDEQSIDGYISSDAYIIASEIENATDEIKTSNGEIEDEIHCAVSELRDLSIDLSSISGIMSQQWRAEYDDRVEREEKKRKGLN